MTTFSTTSLARMARTTPATLRLWAEQGWLRPSPTPAGPRYTLTDAVAAALAIRYRENGSQVDRYIGVLQFVAGVSLADLRRAVEEGRTMVCPGEMLGVRSTPGVLVVPPQVTDPKVRRLMQAVDLAPVYQEVMSAAKRLDRKQSGRKVVA